MEQESTYTKNNHDISIALISKDIEYIKQSVISINQQIQVMDKNYARHEDLKAIIKIYEEFKKQLDGKLNISDFDPIKTTLSRINWMIIVAIVGALLALVVRNV